MHIEHHDLHHEFPEYAQRIHELKLGDAHFAKLFEEYDAINHEIRRLEKEDMPVADARMESLKFTRVGLKDKLYAYLNAGATV